MFPQISQLFVYPIKSCAGIPVGHFQFDEKGPLFDRRWMLVDSETGIFLSQREFPQMALISTRIEDGAVWASLSSESSIDAVIDEEFCLPIEGKLVDVTVWEDDVSGYDCGDAAASWFSKFLGVSCRLVFQGDCSREGSKKYMLDGGEVSFADGFPLLVVAQSSIDALNEVSEAEIGATNFRPNIVVKNTPAFAERLWLSLLVDQSDEQEACLGMTVVKPCERCVIPSLNPKTAKREASIIPALVKYCRVDKKIIFGQNLAFKYFKGAELRVGQSLIINQKD